MAKLHIGFLFLICGSAPKVLNSNYKLFVGKHVHDISLPNVPVIGESGLVGDKDMPTMEPMFGLVKSHILKELIHDAKALQKFIIISTIRKGFCECLIKMLSLQSDAI